jgi:putative ABC transport system substrate-binding protein
MNFQRTARMLATVVSLILFAATPVLAWAQLPVVGYIGVSSPEQEGRVLDAFRAGLKELGHQEGRTLVIEHRWARGDNARFAALARELLDRRPAVIFSPCGPALQAIRQFSTSVPVVSNCADPNNFGREIATITRPGGQTTGFTFLAPESAGKRLELLRELEPKLARVAVLHNRQGDEWPNYWQVMESDALKLGVTLIKLPITSQEGLEGTIALAVRQRAQALIALPDAVTFGSAQRIAALAIQHRLPTAFDLRGFVAAGGLLSYGPDTRDLWRRVGAGYVDKILKGAAPGNLPVQQPTRFELIVNAGTARAIGLRIPRSLLSRADEVIE